MQEFGENLKEENKKCQEGTRAMQRARPCNKEHEGGRAMAMAMASGRERRESVWTSNLLSRDGPMRDEELFG